MTTLPTRAHLPAVLAPLLLAATVAACGAGAASPGANPTAVPPTPTATPTPEPSPTPPPTLSLATVDACQLVTKAEAQAFAHTPLYDGQRGIPTEPSCTYNSPPTGPTAQVELHVGDGAKKAYDIDRQLAHTFTAVPGLGDEAYEEPNAIFVRSGTTWFSITDVLLDVDTATIQAGLPVLARSAVTRLQAAS